MGRTDVFFLSSHDRLRVAVGFASGFGRRRCRAAFLFQGGAVWMHPALSDFVRKVVGQVQDAGRPISFDLKGRAASHYLISVATFRCYFPMAFTPCCSTFSSVTAPLSYLPQIGIYVSLKRYIPIIWNVYTSRAKPIYLFPEGNIPLVGNVPMGNRGCGYKSGKKSTKMNRITHLQKQNDVRNIVFGVTCRSGGRNLLRNRVQRS